MKLSLALLAGSILLHLFLLWAYVTVPTRELFEEVEAGFFSTEAPDPVGEDGQEPHDVSWNLRSSVTEGDPEGLEGKGLSEATTTTLGSIPAGTTVISKEYALRMNPLLIGILLSLVFHMVALTVLAKRSWSNQPLEHNAG